MDFDVLGKEMYPNYLHTMQVVRVQAAQGDEHWLGLLTTNKLNILVI